MKKMVLAGVLSLGVIITSPAFSGVKYSTIINPGILIGAASEGYTANVKGTNKVIFSEFGKTYIENMSKENISDILVLEYGEDGVGNILKDYPLPPSGVSGIFDGINESEFKKIIEANVGKVIVERDLETDKYDIDEQSLENRYLPVSLSGDRFIITDKPGSSDSVVTMYSCDSTEWNRNIDFSDNLGSCISSPYFYDMDVESLNWLVGSLSHVNDAGLSAFRKDNNPGSLSVLDPSRGVFEFIFDGITSKHSNNKIVIGSGEEPIIFIVDNVLNYLGETEYYEYVYKYSKGEVYKYKPLYGEDPSSIPGKLLNVIGDKAYYSVVNDEIVSIGFCDVIFTDSEIKCFEESSETLLRGSSGIVKFGVDGNNVYITLRDRKSEVGINATTVSVNDRKFYNYAYEILKSNRSEYPNLIRNGMKEINDKYPGFLENYPDLPSDLTKYSSLIGLNEKTYLTLSSLLILNASFGNAFTENSIAGFSVTSSKVVSGLGVIDYNEESADEVSIIARPSQRSVDPYTNPVSSIDIVTDGELFAADVSCTVAGSMDITSADYGNWGGSERLTLPLQWTSKDAKGVVSLKGDVDSVSGEQQLLVLDTLAEVTTADVTVNCAATVSDKNGNQLNVNLIPATIRLNDGIHGGSGVITGQVTLPAGVNSEDVTVEVTINGRTIRLNVDENGRFEFNELRDGDFTINVKSEHYTQSCINTQTTGSRIDLGNIELIAGDVNNDGEINIADFTYLAGLYGSAKGDERYTTQADLNSDGKVNVQDLAILGSHFGSRQCNQ